MAEPFIYTRASGTVLNAGANRTLSVNFSPADATNYNAVNGTTVQITVNKATPVITWANPANITYGTALSDTQLNATCNVADIGSHCIVKSKEFNIGPKQTLQNNFNTTA